MKRRFVGAMTAALVTGAVVGSAGVSFALGTANLEWFAQLNLQGDTGSYVTRGMDVDQTNGDVYATIEMGTTRQIVKIPWTGNPGGSLAPEQLTRFGPNFKDSGGNTQLSLSGGLWGVAIDPKTKNMYVSCSIGSPAVGEVHVVSPSGVWLSKFVTDGITARGCAFSDDGMKFAVSWNKAAHPYDSGAKLYTRNLNGTPSDFSDDTWDFAADLVGFGDYAGIGDNYEFTSSPRDVAFDRNGDVLVCGADYWILRYSGSAPYKLAAQYNISDKRVTSRYAVDTDSQNRMFVVANTDGDGVRRVWAVNRDSVPELKFSTVDLGSNIDTGYSLAYDRLHDRVIVTGKDSTSLYAVAASFSFTLETPQLTHITGRITDASTGNPIAGAGVGYIEYNLPSTYLTRIFRGAKEFSGVTNANGEYSLAVPPLDTSGADIPEACIVSVNANGYLSKRVHLQPLAGDTVVNATLSAIGSNTLTWNSLAPMPGDTTGRYRVGEESGLFNQFNRYGGRVTPMPDPNGGAFNVTQIGASNNTSVSGPSGNNMRSADRSLDNYLNFNVDDNWLYRGSPTDTVWITVEYLDTSTAAAGWDALGVHGDFTLQDASLWASPIGDIYKSAPQSNSYKTRTFKATKVSFANAMGDSLLGKSDIDADFRVTAYKQYDYTNNLYPPEVGPDWIKSVKVSKTEPAPEAGSYSSIAAAKAASGDVILSGKVITAQWGADTPNKIQNGNRLYLEEQDRSSGVQVRLFQPWTSLDLRVNRFAKIYGSMMTDPATGEKYIQANSWSDDPFTLPDPLMALWANGRDASRVDVGLSMTAHKVAIAGTVRQVDSGSFTVDDGSDIVKVVIDPSLTVIYPGVGDVVSVEGIATLEGSSPANAVRIVKPWSASNIVTIVDNP
ncbi:MAG: hypothetical protein IT209_01345 [Armatimonadetes bacterium]|nr:hypothetical protein [Armatimonadota bacterium]